ncbi:Malonyl-[acyl-carrier protein] O-methyltransferase [Microbacterium oxydans]|uniref:class I SAM-dependent methyltransferase n=1 Tax=Microbacterium oxydans TaxID=82380 RepID=UPI001D1B9B0C|nr:class I SAM-dependent methyltransferase [Microbacterium oxydans]CAH0183164.1 Malonyl-[acyl-carrier protein] O-methyltransferase [Microbacterium oxydans]
MPSRHSIADAAIAHAYDGRAAEYVSVGGTLEQMDERDRTVIAHWRDTTPGTLLDAGCGPGHWTAFLHAGHRTVSGVDLSPALLASARSRFPHLSFEQASFRALPHEDGALGGILAWYSLIHTPPADIPAVLAEFARLIEPGGSVLIGFFDGEAREEFAHAVTPAYFWSADALTAALAAAGFEVVSQERRERAPDEISRRAHGHMVARRR